MTLHVRVFFFFFFNDTATTEIYTLSLHDALPICVEGKKKYWPMKNTRAIRTAANTARFSMLTSLVASSGADPDRKSTRLNSSHGYISYAVFCLKKKNISTTAKSRPAHQESHAHAS